MTNALLGIGALFGLAAVLLGAFGAHGLADQVTPARLAVWDTAAEYLGWHGTTLLALGALARGGRLLRVAGWCLVAGAMVFSGSLFLLVLTDTPALGAITPIGGVTLAAGWALAALGLWRGGR